MNSNPSLSNVSNSTSTNLHCNARLGNNTREWHGPEEGKCLACIPLCPTKDTSVEVLSAESDDNHLRLWHIHTFHCTFSVKLGRGRGAGSKNLLRFD